MSRMIDLIRSSKVPANLMQSAARGSLSVPPMETIEILVHLSLHHKTFGQQARLTLAGWDENVCLTAAQNPGTSSEVLGYWISPENLRIPLLATLIENPSVGEESIHKLAARGGRPVVEVLLASSRVNNSAELLKALQSNPNLRPTEIAEIEKKLGASSATTAASAPEATGAEREEIVETAIVETVLDQYLKENAKELEAVKDKPFQAHDDVGGATAAESHDEATETKGEPVEAKTATASAGAALAPAAQSAAAAQAKAEPHADRRDSAVQKIAKLDVKGRIALAVRGNKEERSILIRDMTKVVCLAVLDSPKLSDAEVEGFAKQRNVLDSVLRTIPMKRRFAKNYAIQKNLAFNPRTPTDASLGLMKNLLAHDLKVLAENKEVPDSIRKLALRMFRQKMERHKS
jgi:hypothetical protein